MVVALSATAYIWFTIQKEIVSPEVQIIAPEEQLSPEQTEASIISTEGIIVPEEGIVIDPDVLSPTQKAIAEKVGIDVESMTITPEMIACAQEKLGIARTQEIAEGSTPTILEALSLAACI